MWIVEDAYRCMVYGVWCVGIISMGGGGGMFRNATVINLKGKPYFY